MELPGGRLPESFGAPAFPEPRPFEIRSRRPAGRPAAGRSRRPAGRPAAARSPRPAGRADRDSRRARDAVNAGRAAREAARRPAGMGAVKRPPAVPAPQPPPKPAARRAGPVAVALVVFAVAAVAVCRAVARNTGDDDAAGGAPGAAATTAAARAAEAGAPSEVAGPCPAIGFLGADGRGPDALDARRAVQPAVSRHNETGSPACPVRLVGGRHRARRPGGGLPRARPARRRRHRGRRAAA
ncbi:hypothetical protein ACQP2P_32905 [Dactylosporangium sp. CA-139114]|uniref:hypothetical protein n=1 Tax=Dactylosporangium sp. CA-139114 TaxID=3239931 RepID=UPI003D991D80